MTVLKIEIGRLFRELWLKRHGKETYLNLEPVRTIRIPPTLKLVEGEKSGKPTKAK